MKRFVIGDIHARFTALKEVLKKSKFDYKKDKLIVLGDVVDGGLDTFKVVEELLKIDNLIYIFGNHDLWAIGWFKHGSAPNIWITQGGANTVRSYGGKVADDGYVVDDAEIEVPGVVPVTHQHFFNTGVYYHVEDDMVFVHGGFNPFTNKPLQKQKKSTLVWDRELIQYAKKHVIKQYKYVFVGHTATQYINGTDTPQQFNNLWCMDTGAGYKGFLTIMDITNSDKVQYWQSKEQKPAGR